MMDEDEASTRYAFLLQPIRDLQKNWDIDISHLLEEFFERIRELSESGECEEEVNDHHNAKFNFAEAAVLIQGSTMVYGKKVEYVHGLAHDFYEQLKDKKKPRKHGNTDQDDNVDHVEMDHNEDPETLDDPCELMEFKNLKVVDWKTLMLKNEAKPPQKIPQIPISLLPLSDFEKTNVPLYSSRNLKEVIGKKDDFIINTGFVHKSGALLLDLANAKLIDEFENEETVDQNSAYIDETGVNVDNQADLADTEHLGTAISDIEKVRRATSGTNVNMMTGRETSNVNLVSAIAPSEEPAMDNLNLDMNDDNVADAWQGFDNSEDGKHIEYHPADEEAFSGAEEDEPVMDIFRPQHYKHAPYHACKPSFIPEQVEKRRMKKREKLGLKASPSLSEFLQQHIYRSLPKRPVLCDDFTLIFGKLMRNLEKQRMKIIKSNISMQSKHDQQQQYLEADAYAEEDNQDDYNDHNNEYSSDDDHDDRDLSAEVPDDANLTFAGMANDDLEGRVRVSSLYMNFDDPGLSLKPPELMTYQDLLKVHLQKYWSSAEETTSRLCKRVQLWEEKIQPILEEEETRREFDIHLYGTELLEQFENIGETINFSQLARSVGINESYDISRYCLAALMLANTGNIELDDAGNDGPIDGNDVMLSILKKERHHQVFSKSPTILN